MNRTLPGPAGDVALVLARLILATIMFAHGYQKLFIYGLGRTTQGFESMSIPVAIVSAAFVTVVEVVGSVLVLAGALITVVAACYLIVMVGAAVFVHIPHGIFAADGGWELVGAIAALLLVLAATGPGRWSVDHRSHPPRLRADPPAAPARRHDRPRPLHRRSCRHRHTAARPPPRRWRTSPFPPRPPTRSRSSAAGRPHPNRPRPRRGLRIPVLRVGPAALRSDLRRQSRLGESNPRPTHYEKSRHRLHLLPGPSVHVRVVIVHTGDGGRTAFQGTNQATTEIKRPSGA